MSLEVKICGLVSPNVIDAAGKNGARWVGFVFFPPSPRYVDARLAIDLAAIARSHGMETVGVYVNPTDRLLDETAPAVDWIQLHGQETPERAQAIRAQSGKRLIKALPIAEAADVEAARTYEAVVDMILFDAKAQPGTTRLPGGNGRAFDWTLLEGRTPSLPWMLSGGLDADNLAQAVLESGAKRVDVSSGVEDAPGLKSLDKIAQFMNHARTPGPKEQTP
ncbi:N-(5'-phosphoribosyl)anthranilate isomerase [Iodidimonas muriae]|uniref:N-(5'-phosphoribosyl)anthranilate isomerase n=1 Tax=Iodidimonas muriae TaxID=261467 RepID=A0ABQ2LDM0_9PROT|nr:phosphoribosylanthranilate isomerase [Iodidimonas muriae]GER07863.1 N-(5'-phosphoribosyl)anthranilate isomerase [Kordiimonadales bacterium JCM 17843]GGO12098.1 N-(5'-phosphoribosyl)anthranilate isomerase [Iodidimonas muriae]